MAAKFLLGTAKSRCARRRAARELSRVASAAERLRALVRQGVSRNALDFASKTVLVHPSGFLRGRLGAAVGFSSKRRRGALARIDSAVVSRPESMGRGCVYHLFVHKLPAAARRRLEERRVAAGSRKLCLDEVEAALGADSMLLELPSDVSFVVHDATTKEIVFYKLVCPPPVAKLIKESYGGDVDAFVATLFTAREVSGKTSLIRGIESSPGCPTYLLGLQVLARVRTRAHAHARVRGAIFPRPPLTLHQLLRAALPALAASSAFSLSASLSLRLRTRPTFCCSRRQAQPNWLHCPVRVRPVQWTQTPRGREFVDTVARPVAEAIQASMAIVLPKQSASSLRDLDKRFGHSPVGNIERPLGRHAPIAMELAFGVGALYHRDTSNDDAHPSAYLVFHRRGKNGAAPVGGNLIFADYGVLCQTNNLAVVGGDFKELGHVSAPTGFAVGNVHSAESDERKPLRGIAIVFTSSKVLQYLHTARWVVPGCHCSRGCNTLRQRARALLRKEQLSLAAADAQRSARLRRRRGDEAEAAPAEEEEEEGEEAEAAGPLTRGAKRARAAVEAEGEGDDEDE